jgi:hypothetical protein
MPLDRTDKDWYKKLPVEELNKLLESSGWTVREIYSALILQSLDLETEIRDKSDALLYSNLDFKSSEYKEKKEEFRSLEEKARQIGRGVQ